jgi:hypothetical protein
MQEIPSSHTNQDFDKGDRNACPDWNETGSKSQCHPNGFGIAWFIGSAAMGLLNDKSILVLVLFSVVLQIAALPVLFFAGRLEKE